MRAGLLQPVHFVPTLDAFFFALKPTWAIFGTGTSPPGGGSDAALAMAFQLYWARSSAMSSRFLGSLAGSGAGAGFGFGSTSGLS